MVNQVSAAAGRIPVGSLTISISGNEGDVKMKTLIEFKNVTKEYKIGGVTIKALAGVDMIESLKSIG